MSDAKRQKTEAEKAAFMAVFDKLVDFLVNDPLLGDEQPEQSKQWMKRMLDYNVPHGKLNRGMAVLDAMLSLDEGKDACDDAMKNSARMLGWCIEFLQAYFLVADDIMPAEPQAPPVAGLRSLLEVVRVGEVVLVGGEGRSPAPRGTLAARTG